MSRLALAPLLLSAILGTSAGTSVIAAGPPPEVTIENVRVGFGDGQNSDQYKAGSWTPFWVDLKAGPSRFEGILKLTVPDDNNTPTTIRRAVNIPANEMGTVALFGRPGPRGGDMEIQVEANGRVKDAWSGGNVSAIGAETALIVTVGAASGVGDVAELAKYASSVSGLNSQIVVMPIRARYGLPSRWYGFDAADAVVVDTGDPAALSRLREAKPLIDWVRQGGHLVIAVGQNWQAVKDSPFEPLLPAVPTGRIELSDPGLIDQFAGASNKPLVAPGSKEKVLATKFEGWEARGGVPLASSAATPLILRGPYGFGRVTMIGLDVDKKPFASWEEKKNFWDKALDLRGRGVEAANVIPGAPAYGNGTTDLSGGLHSSLERFPGVRLVPFGWVAFFVFLYILLIGPGDYFFLRKVVKRMEMTWITFPLIVVIVSGLAYAAAYHFKGTELRINKVDLVDVDQTTGLVRGRTWLTLFSPQNRDYDLGIAPLPPEAEPPADPLAKSPKTANVETITSWFGAAENPYGGGGGLSLAGGGYSYAPMSEPEELKGVRVAIWSTKSFTGRWSGTTAAALLEADLTPDGPDRVRGTVTNVSRRPMKNAALFFGRYVYTLNDVAPGATVVLGEAQALAGYMDGVIRAIPQSGVSYYPGPQPARPDDSSAEDDRPNLVRALMFHSGMGAKGASITSHALRPLDLTGQLDLHRPMLVAEVAGPTALLRLEGQGSKPKMAQTSLVRVILPLKADPSTGPPAAP